MKILIVKTSALGDIIHCFPALHFIKDKVPTAQIHWVVEKPFAELVSAHPDVDCVHTVDTKQWRKLVSLKECREFFLKLDDYDILFDFQGNCKSGLITWLASAPVKVGFGRKTVAEWPNVMAINQRFNPPSGQNIRDDYLFLARSVFNDFKTPARQDVVLTHEPFSIPKVETLVCPGSAWPNKQLSTSSLKRFLKDKKSLAYVFGNDEEHRLCQELQSELGGEILPKMALASLQAVMRQVDLVVAMDSLPLHLAGTTATPTVSFFGPSWGEKYRPIGEQHTFFQGVCPYGKTFEKRCPILRTCKTGACIKQNLSV